MRIHKHKQKTYTEKLKEFVGPPKEGRTDYFHLTHKQSIDLIKEQLKSNFSCNLWTLEWPNWEIGYVDNALTQEGIVHCLDEFLDCFICFNTEEDMKNFYIKLRKESKEEDLQYLRDHGYNTPIIKWFEK